MVFSERDRQFLRQNPDVTEDELRQIKRRLLRDRLLGLGISLALAAVAILIVALVR